MILVFNALNVRPGVHDGAATFSLNVLRHLPAALPEARIVALVQPEESRVAGVERLEVHEVPGTSSRPRRIALETVWLTRELRRLRADVLLAPYESIPLAPPCPVVCVAQNLVYHCGDLLAGHVGETAAQRAATRAQAAYYRRRMRSAYRRSAAVIAVSAETARVLAARAGLDPTRVTVVPEGADSAFLPAPVARTREPRVLSVGSLAPHKDHELAIDVFARVARARPELVLEIVGADWRGYGAVVRAHAAGSGLGERISFADDLGAEALAERYDTSRLLLQLSRCESFGLPVAEAMRHGLPVAIASRSSLPEVAGGAALVLDPAKPGDAATAVAALLDDEAAAQALAAKGRQRAAELTWARTAAEIADVLRLSSR
jgi:glycosyltransferase involved in cell wall biosynthesis